ncbi:hypothetical protein FBR02_19720 [Anaerolineae bacterium CFX9]|nr:hypothetical protein [Anaerolineae bacterium CFX9]
MLYTFATLDDLRLHLGLLPDETRDDRRLLDLLTAASAGIEQFTGRRFLPRRAVYTLDAPASGTVLALPDDLLQLISISDARGAIPLEEIGLTPDHPPYAALESLTGWQWQSRRRDAITVTGLWGWHGAWASAWYGSGDEVRDDPLTGASTVMQVVDVAGADTFARAPRFQIGQVLRIGDEFMQVLGINAEANLLTLRRAVLGTTNTVHTRFQSITIYLPPPAVAQAALLWAEALYRGHESPPPDALALIAPLRLPHRL